MNDIERLHYFNNQFLKEEDFTDEQTYHLDMRRRHNRLLHSPGIAEGLEVQRKDAKKVTVKPGTAIDREGREIVLLKEEEVSLSEYSAGSTVYITITYEDSPPKENTEENKNKWQPQDANRESNQYTRTLEKAVIKTATEIDSTTIKLAKFTLDATGSVPDQELDGGVRDKASAKLPDFSVSVKQLRTFTKPEWDNSERVGTNKPLEVPVFETSIDSASTQSPNIGAFILVYASSTTPQAIFEWGQQYRVVNKKDENNNDITVQTQYIIFINKTDPAITIEIKYKIYAVLE